MGNDGALCIRHDPPVAVTFPRGRPFALLDAAEPQAVADVALDRELIAVGVEAQA